MTPLRQKMIDLMSFRQFSPKTHEAYLHAVSLLANHYQRSPEHIHAEEIKDWLIETANERHWSDSTVHQVFNGIKFLYYEVLTKKDFLTEIKLPKRAQKIPDLLSKQEVCAILQATGTLKHQTLLSVCYGCGLRVSELVALKPEHIDAEHHLLMIQQSKGRKDRRVPLPDSLLKQLRYYWKSDRPQKWLFDSNRKGRHLSISSAQKVYGRAKQTAGISKSGGIHSLRHAYATHQIEQGLSIHSLQNILGHKNIQVTLRYLHWVPEQQGEQSADLLALFLLSRPVETREVKHEPF